MRCACARAARQFHDDARSRSGSNVAPPPERGSSIADESKEKERAKRAPFEAFVISNLWFHLER